MDCNAHSKVPLRRIVLHLFCCYQGEMFRRKTEVTLINQAAVPAMMSYFRKFISPYLAK